MCTYFFYLAGVLINDYFLSAQRLGVSKEGVANFRLMSFGSTQEGRQAHRAKYGDAGGGLEGREGGREEEHGQGVHKECRKVKRDNSNQQKPKLSQCVAGRG